jgi:hypothetical protein
MAEKAFDPDEYLKARGLLPDGAKGDFDPDAYLSERGLVVPPVSDDPNERAALRVARGVKSPLKVSPPGGTISALEDRGEAMGLGAGNAATFGMLNRGLGAVDYLRGGSASWGAGTDKVAAAEEAIRAKHPGFHIAGSILGGVGTGVGLARSGVGFARDGAGMLQRIGMGAAEGAGLGAASGAGQTYSGNAEDYAKNAIIGGAFGFGGGAIGEGLGGGAGAAYKAFKDYRNPTFPEPIIRAGRADVQGLQDLPRLGPDAMLPDAGPSMQSTAQAANLGIGANRTAITNALRNRDAATVGRLQADTEAAIGPPPRVSEVEAGIDAGRKQINTEYDPVLRGRAIEPGEANRVMGRLNELALTTRTNLDEVVGALTVPGHNLPDLSPQAWLGARQRVDSMIEAASNPMNPDRYRASVLIQVRKMIDDELAANVPGVKAVDAKFAANRAEQEALQTGRNILDTGKGAVHPDDLRDLMRVQSTPQGVAPAGPPAANLRLRQGTRAEIDRRVGTKANDLTELERTLGTPEDWNAQKLNQIFGPEAAQAVRDSVARNRQFRETYQRVAQGSDTAQRQAAEKTSGIATMPVPTRNIAGTVEQVGRWGLGQAIEAQKQVQREAMARILATRDPAEVLRLRNELLAHIRGTAAPAQAVNRTARGVAQGTGMLLGPAFDEYLK